MNYLDQWTFFPDLSEKPEENSIQLYEHVSLDPMTEGTVGNTFTPVSGVYFKESIAHRSLPALMSIYYSRKAVDTLKEKLLFSSPVYRYHYSFQNSLAKPSLPYYPLSV